jgi:choline dehydrogenase-like flavoprotein
VIVPLNRLADTGQPIQPPPDVQRTTMSLDVLGRFVCNTWDEAIDNGGASFDAVIVGGGMFGGYCADKIARSSGDHPLRVLVLEAGPFLVPTLVQNLPRAGLDVPDPIFPSADNGVPRDCVGHPLAQQRAVRRPSLLRRGQVALLGRLVPAASGRRLEFMATLGRTVSHAELPDTGRAGRRGRQHRFHSGTPVQSAQDALRCLGAREHRQRQ